MTPIVPALLACFAVLAWRLPAYPARRVRPAAPRRTPAPGWATARHPAMLRLAAAASVAGLLAGPVAAAVAAPAVLAVPALAARLSASRQRDAVRRAVPSTCRLLAAQLRAGADPRTALAAAAEAAPGPLAGHLRRTAVGAAMGLDPPRSLADGPPGAEGLAALAACWQVTAATGAGLATATERLAEALAAEERLRGELAAQLAGPRASAVVLGVLPLAGVGLAALGGARPLAFFGTPPGAGCLALGLLLDLAGLLWTLRLARSALR